MGLGAKLLTALALVLALAGCAGAQVSPIGADGAPFALELDERELWTAAGRESEAIARAGKPRAAPAIEAALTALAARLMPPSTRVPGAPAPDVTVLMDPAVAAFALPTGRIYVHSGLLARVEGESRLAAILAREVAHVTRRDALALFRDGRRLTAGPTPRAPGAALAGLPLARAAAVDGYGDREGEADAEALRALAAAGFDPREAPRAFDALREDLARARDARGDGPYALGRAAWLGDRARSLRALLDREPAGVPSTGSAGGAPGASEAAGGTTATVEDALAQLLLPLVRDNAVLEARAGHSRSARAQLDRVLAAGPGDVAAHLADGELLRLEAQRAGSREDARALLARARRAFERAAALDPASPEPHRALALVAYQAGDAAAARAAFERYLSMRPDAPDARRVREYLQELGPRPR